jgi:hypothetical protein
MIDLQDSFAQLKCVYNLFFFFCEKCAYNRFVKETTKVLSLNSNYTQATVDKQCKTPASFLLTAGYGGCCNAPSLKKKSIHIGDLYNCRLCENYH